LLNFFFSARIADGRPMPISATTCLITRGQPAVNAAGLPLRRRPTSSAASTSLACLLHLHPTSVIIIVIVIIHPLFKRNFYFSLLCDLLFFSPLHSLKSFSFSSPKCAVEEFDILLLLTQPLPCFAYLCVFYFSKVCSSTPCLAYFGWVLKYQGQIFSC
jgi:hypothetical protein